MRNFLGFGLMSTLMACTPGPEVQLDDARFATGSRTMVANADADRLFAVNVDEGTISRIDLQNSTIDNIDIGMDPTRIARAGDTGIYRIVQNRSVELHTNYDNFLASLATRRVNQRLLRVSATGGFASATQTMSAVAVTVLLQ